MKVFILCMVLFLGLNLTVAPGLYLNADPGKDIDLVKMKKEEEERKKKAKKKGKTFTNEDLKKMKDSGEKVNITLVEPGNAGKSSTRKALKPDPDSDPGKGEGKLTGEDNSLKTESYWQSQKNKLLDEIRRTKDAIKKNKAKVADLRYQLTRKLPDTLLLDEKLRLEKEIDQTEKANISNQQNLVDLNRALEELYERARKAGVPPGWLRGRNNYKSSPDNSKSSSDKQ